MKRLPSDSYDFREEHIELLSAVYLLCVRHCFTLTHGHVKMCVSYFAGGVFQVLHHFLERLSPAGSIRELPDDAPLDFIRERWARLIFTDTCIDRRYYELCALAELKNALRSGDIWVEGSRKFKNFNEYLLPAQRFAKLRETGDLRLAVDPDCEQYLKDRLEALNQQLHRVDSLAGTNDLPDAILTDSGLKITPFDASVPQAAQRLVDQVAASLPHIKVTDLLLEVDTWTGFTGHFTHLKSGDAAKDRIPLLTAILADAINMAYKDGRVMPGSELCKALVAAGLAHPR